VYFAQTQNISQAVHIKQYLRNTKKFTNQTQPFTAIHIHQQVQLNNKSHTSATQAGTALCKPFCLRYLQLLVLRMVADGMQVMDNIKCGIYSFYVRHKLTVCFPSQLAGKFIILTNNSLLPPAFCSQY
jgi:hypothetical protein